MSKQKLNYVIHFILKADEEIRTLDPSPWQGDALPLSYIRKVSAGSDLSDMMMMHHRGALGQFKSD